MTTKDTDMLILTRNVNQSILIGDGITVTILGIKGAQVRLGISAPKEVPVHRREVYDRISAENGGHVGVGQRGRGAA